MNTYEILVDVFESKTVRSTIIKIKANSPREAYIEANLLCEKKYWPHSIYYIWPLD